MLRALCDPFLIGLRSFAFASCQAISSVAMYSARRSTGISFVAATCRARISSDVMP